MNKNRKSPAEFNLAEFETAVKNLDFSGELDTYEQFLAKNQDQVRLTAQKHGFIRFAPAAFISGTAAVLTLALVIFFNTGFKGPWQGRPDIIEGSVLLSRNGTTWKKLYTGDRLQSGDMLRTDSNASAVVRVGSKLVFRVERNSEIRMHFNHNTVFQAEIALNRGAVQCRPAKLDKNEHVEVLTPYMLSRVTGTVFMVRLNTNGNSELFVTEGAVAVKPYQTEHYQELDPLLPVQTVEKGQGISLSSNVSQQLLAKAAAIITDPVLSNQTAAGLKAAGPFKRLDISPEDKEILDSLSLIVPDTEAAGRYIDIISRPEGAMVEYNGRRLGRTPVSVWTSDDSDLTLKLELQGFEPLLTNISRGQKEQSVYNLIPSADKTGLFTPIWKYQLSLDENDRAYYHNGKFYLIGIKGIQILDTNGRRLRSKSLDDAGNLTEPLFSGPYIIFGSSTGMARFINADTLETMAGVETGIQKLFLKPFRWLEKTGFLSVNMGLRMVKGNTVEQVFKTEEAYYGQPYISKNGVMIAGSSGGLITAINLNDGRQLYQKKFLEEKILLPVVGFGNRYYLVYRDSGNILAADLDSGELLWTQGLKEIVKTDLEPLIWQKNLVVPVRSGLIIVLDPENGTVISRMNTGREIRMIKTAGNRLLVLTENGKGIAYDYPGATRQPFGLERMSSFTVSGSHIIVTADDSIADFVLKP